MAAAELSRRLKIPADGVVAVFNAPPEYEAAAHDGHHDADVVELFALDRAGLERDFPAAFATLKADGQFWVIYPSPDSGRATDLSHNHGMGVLGAAGFAAMEDVKLDAGWNAKRFVRGRSIPSADMLPVGRRASPLFRVVRLVALPMFRAMFRFDVQGRERIPDSAYVLIANHLGWMDAISLLLLFPPEPRIHYLADPTSMMRNRPLWTLVRATGGIVPVDRAQRGNPALFKHVARCLERGGVVALFPEGEFGPREEWGRAWTSGVDERKKVVKPADTVWETTRDGKIRVLCSKDTPDVRVFSVDVFEQEIPAGSRSAKHLHMADEVFYILSGSGHSLHWEVEAEIAERYYARVALEPTRHEFTAGDTLYVPQNTVHQQFNSSETEPLRLLSAQNRLIKHLGYDNVVYFEDAPEFAGAETISARA